MIEKFPEPPKPKSIRDWREDERPREILLKRGASALKDSELLAIILSSGTFGKSAVELANELLDFYGSVSGLVGRSVAELCRFKGIGEVKAIKFAASIELAKRIAPDPFSERASFRSPEDIANYYIPKLCNEKQERFVVIMLDSAGRMFKEQTVTVGALNASIAHPREIFKTAIAESAASIILLHNHPSGNPEPSREDIEVTKQIVEAGKLIGILALDHIIIAGNSFTSFVRLGLIQN
ncbi:MAG: RadC family protein [Chloroflexota bacterium]